MLLYQKTAVSFAEFDGMLEYLLEANSVYIFAGDFN